LICFDASAIWGKLTALTISLEDDWDASLGLEQRAGFEASILPMNDLWNTICTIILIYQLKWNVKPVLQDPSILPHLGGGGGGGGPALI